MTTKYFRISKAPIEYLYILADDAKDAIKKAKEEYGIPVTIPALDCTELTSDEWCHSIDGVPDENGGHYNGDGTAWFYNDEYHELYRLDPEKRIWFPVNEPEDWDDLDDNHHEDDIDTGFNRDSEDAPYTLFWLDDGDGDI